MAKRKDDRGRVWAFELYPDSAPENWREIISGWHVPVVVSPLHEFDLNPDGTTKKRTGMLYCSLMAINLKIRLKR